MLRAGSRASSARFETVSIPVYAIIPTGIASSEAAPRRRDAPVDVVDQRLGAEDRARSRAARAATCVAKSITASVMFSVAASLIPTTLSDDEDDDHDGAADDVPRVLAQRLPEDREVVRDEERRDGDRDHVVEHLGPRRPEADELVEGVPREARGAAGLRVADRALGVRERGCGEEEPGDDEDERRQPEGEDRRDAERVVDRGADVAVRGREERRRPEHALEPLLAASGHRRTLVRPSGRHEP